MKRHIPGRCIYLAFFLVFLGSVVHSQALTTEDIRTQMVKEWERAKAYTMDYLDKMPADKYGFKAVDSMRSFAQQMVHLAQANWFLMSAATDMPMPKLEGDLEKVPSAQTKDSVKYYVGMSYDFCINAVKNSD